MISSFTRSASGGLTTSIVQHQVAREQWREGKSAGSDKPRCSKLREHQLHQHLPRTSVGTSDYTSTTSLEPRINARPECYTLDEVQSELIKSETSRTTNSEEEG